MKKNFILMLMYFASFSVFAANQLTPVGDWQTIDDVTGKPKSILHIFAQGNALYGQVSQIYPRPGHDQHEICKACKGDKHNQPIVGMIVMDGLKATKTRGEWSDGQILDPHNGKTYRCTITLVNQGEKLNVRGYIGFSLFGRTQTWNRIG